MNEVVMSNEIADNLVKKSIKYGEHCYVQL